MDTIGFVFYPKSKRCLTPARAQLRRRVPAFVDVVALFVNPADDEVRAVLDQVGPELLQFHGDETPQQCAHHGQRFLRAFRVSAPGLDTAAGLAAQCRAYGESRGLAVRQLQHRLWRQRPGLRSRVARRSARRSLSRPLILSGGLKPENVGQAVRFAAVGR